MVCQPSLGKDSSIAAAGVMVQKDAVSLSVVM